MNQSKTYENLMAAFAGESQANRKYTAYAQKADKEGRKNAAKLFRAAADAETIHALTHFQTAGQISDTQTNLQDAVNGENYEAKSMYPEFLKTAQEEGDQSAIRTFTYALQAEEVHAKLYQEALDSQEEKEEIFYYLCPICGDIEKAVPGKCPICGCDGSKFIQY